MGSQTYEQQFLIDFQSVVDQLDIVVLTQLVSAIKQVKQHGRLFLLGVGGSAANCSHAVNDFRKMCCIDALTPTDNVSELTARTNDNGWERTFIDWLICSHLSSKDVILVLSVGGGSDTVSRNLVLAVGYAKGVGAKVLGVVGKDGGYTARVADVCLIVPTPIVDSRMTTPFTETCQSVILHLLAFHPDLQS